MNTLHYTQSVAKDIANLTGIPCYTETDLETFQGERNDVFILSLTQKEDVLALNNTHKLHFNLSYVVQPDTMSNDEALKNITDAYAMMMTSWRGKPRYTENEGAFFLQFEDEQLMTINDGTKTNLSWNFAVIVHFDF